MRVSLSLTTRDLLSKKTDSQIPFLKVKDYKPVAHPPVTPSTIPAATPTGGEDSVQPDNPDKPQDPNAPRIHTSTFADAADTFRNGLL